MGEQVAQYEVGVPAAALRPYVTRYTGYRYEGFAPGVHVGLPSRHLTFIVSLGAPLEVGQLDRPEMPVRRFGGLVGGLHTAPAAVHHDGTQHGVQLDVTPRGARALFAMPAAELAGLTVTMDAVLGRLAGELVERVHGAGTWAQRFAALDRVLLRAVAPAGDAAPQVARAWRQLTATAGGVEVGALAAALGWSRRHLSEQFRREIGLPPKTVARIMRFERARYMVATGRWSLGTVAIEAGYADQAHMNRDWREFAGASPTRWLADEQLPFFQDGQVRHGPDSLHG